MSVANITLRCDECLEELALDVSTIANARRAAADEWWSGRDGHDICSDCSATSGGEGP